MSEELSGAVKDGMRQLLRNGRWGTCSACPRDGDGRPLPELCKRTASQDHQLTFAGLLELHTRQQRARGWT